MNIIADTNVLLRAVLGDHLEQSRKARYLLRSADKVILGRYALCEMVWVLTRSYKLPKDQITKTVLVLLDAENVITDTPAAEAGLAAMNSGADFADGVIAHEGQRLGGEEFVSFDKKAVAMLARRGIKARLLT